MPSSRGSQEELFRPHSTRPPSSDSAHYAPRPAEPVTGSSPSSPLRDIGETSIRGGLSPDLRSVDEDTLRLHEALHQIRTAPLSSTSLLRSPVVIRAEHPTRARSEHTKSPPPASTTAALSKKRSRRSAGEVQTPGVLDKKRGRLSAVLTGAEEDTRTAHDDRGDTSVEQADATRRSGARWLAAGRHDGDMASSRTRVTMLRSGKATSTSAVDDDDGLHRSGASSIQLSRPPPLANSVQPSARELSAGEAYWRQRYARTGMRSDRGGCAESEALADAEDGGRGDRQDDLDPPHTSWTPPVAMPSAVLSSPGRRGAATRAVTPPRMSINRASSPSRRERSLVLDPHESPLVNEEEEEGPEGHGVSAQPPSPPRWRRSPVRWTPRLSGTLESDIAKVQRLLTSAAQTPRDRAVAKSRSALPAARRATTRHAESQPPPPPPLSSAQAGGAGVHALAGTPPPRFEENGTQFYHAARAWRQPVSPGVSLRDASDGAAPRVNDAETTTRHASVDGLMAYYTRRTAGCRQTPTLAVSNP